jgi:hypothetical protein
VTNASKGLGLKPSIILPIAAGDSSYGTEVQRVIASHPDGLIFEIDSPSDAGTFLSNLATATGGSVKIPLLTDETSLDNAWVSAIQGSVGVNNIKAELHVVGALPSPASPGLAPLANGYPKFKSAIPFTSGQQAPIYDDVILTALAMLKAHSTEPSVFTPLIAKLAAKPNDKRIRVYTYAKGKADLAKGEDIAYWGAHGPMGWTSRHVRVSGFYVGHWVPGQGGGASTTTIGSPISSSQIAAALHIS